MDAPYTIYSASLKPLGLGHAMWYPEPHQSGEVQIGDVGFLEEGAFVRLLNIDTSAPEKNVTCWQPPFEISDPPPAGLMKIDQRVRPLAPGHYCSPPGQSKSIRVSTDISVASVASAGIEYTFKTGQDAVLVLKSEAHIQEILTSGELEDYVRRHHESWCTYAKDVLRRTVKPSAIVLISGWVKTSPDWAIMAFSHKSSSSAVSLGAGVTGLAYFDAGFNDTSSTDRSTMHRYGKDYLAKDSEISTPHTRDQTVFIRQYKLQWRFRFPVLRCESSTPSLLLNSDRALFGSFAPISSNMRTNNELMKGPVFLASGVFPHTAVYAVYASSLGTSIGHALYSPEPHETGEVQTGDVGFINEGAFVRLHNLDVSAPEKVVPCGESPFIIVDALPFEVFRDRSTYRLLPGTYSGKEIDLYGSPNRAVLELPDGAHGEMLSDSSLLEEYIIKNHDSWYAHARDRINSSVKQDQLVVVKGWVKTSDDARAFFMRSQPQPMRAETWIQGLGDEDWCIFLSYYKVEMRRGRVAKVVSVGGLKSELEYSPTLHLSDMRKDDPLADAAKFISSR